MKTNSSAKKRFRLTGTGKVSRRNAYMSHILTKMSTKRKRELGNASLVHDADMGNVKRMLCIGKKKTIFNQKPGIKSAIGSASF